MPKLACRLALALGALGAVAVAVPALADPPARVGRLSEVTGTVSFHAAGDEQWSPAVLNEPVTSGDAFWTEPGAHAEIRIGSTALHMDSSTELDIDTLDDRQLAARLPQGTLNLHIRRLGPGEGYSLATPRGTVVLAGAGTYHIDAGADGSPTRIAVLHGTAQMIEGGAKLTLGDGEAALVTGTDRFSYSIEEAQPTPFDDASLARDRREDAPRPAARYVSPEMTGAEDLDDYGTWQTVPQYGPVWYPQAVPVGWVPYREGHWRWVAPWGWTWVDDEPWGFAPFHYGRWAFIDGRWGWCPGTVVIRPVYAPALVAFVGGGGWSLSVSVGAPPASGWFPLAPREVYVPPYPTSVTYIRNVNVTNVTNVTNINVTNVNVTKVNYANRQFATVVPQAAFAASRPVAKAALTVPREAVIAAPVAKGAPLAPAVAAQSGHPQAVTRANAVARTEVAQPRPPQGPAIAAPAKPVAPGPAIAGHAKPLAQALPESERMKGAPPAPGAEKRKEAPAPGPAIDHAAASATPAHPASPGPPVKPAATAAPVPQPAPGPAIAGHAKPLAQALPESERVKGAPPAPGAENHKQAAAPGPAINHAAEATTPPHPVSPGPPINHAATATPAPHPAPAPPSEALRPNHGQQNEAKAAPHPQPHPQPQASHAAAARPAPVPERAVPHPTQQTMLQPTQHGWVRAPQPPQPPPQQSAQHQGKPQEAAKPHEQQGKGRHPGQPEQKTE